MLLIIKSSYSTRRKVRHHGKSFPSSAATKGGQRQAESPKSSAPSASSRRPPNPDTGSEASGQAWALAHYPARKGNRALQAKIARFIGAGTAKLHFVFDFDRTLTVPHHQIKEDITSWGILKDHLPEEAKNYHNKLYDIYRAKELNGTMTGDDAVEWWSSILDLFAAHSLDLKAVEKDFLDRASIRTGAAELLLACKGLEIPIVILSAGIKDVIDLWGTAYGITPSLVLSTVLKLDGERRIIGWDKDTLVHVLNKAETDHAELRNIRVQRPLAIVVGDSINDADMASGDENTLRVRILDPRPDETVDMEAERTKTFEHFDTIIENGTLFPLVELLEIIRNE